MKRKIIIGVLLIVAIFSFSSLALASSSISTIEVTDAKLRAESSFGAGSDYPLMAPSETGMAYRWSIQPVKMIWTIYDPGFHQITTLEHPPSTVFQDGNDWIFADKTMFTLPSFAQVGTWAASCKVVFANGTSSEIEWDGYMYQGIPCGNSGDIIGNFFIYPWYFFGWKAPAYFWFPLMIFWGPVAAVFMLAGLARVFPTTAEIIRDSLDRFRKTARGGKRSKKRKPTK